MSKQAHRYRIRNERQDDNKIPHIVVKSSHPPAVQTPVHQSPMTDAPAVDETPTTEALMELAPTPEAPVVASIAVDEASRTEAAPTAETVTALLTSAAESLNGEETQAST